MASREEQKRKLREEREAAKSADTDAAERRKRTAFLAGGIGLIALIVVVALVLVSQAGNDDKTVDSTDVFAGIPQKGIALGEPDAPVTVVEFADLQCPFCRDFAVDDLPGIVTDYVEPGDVKMELRLLAFIGADSEAGRGVAARAAEQDLIWPFAEEVYNNQGTENSGYMTTDFLSEQASAVPGLDVQLALDASGSATAERYAQESDDEAQKAGVSNTPSFAVTPDGGETEVVDADGLRGAIDDAISQAKG